MLKSLYAAVAIWLVALGAQAACNPDHVDLRGDWGSAKFSVEIADTAPLRSQGLMNRPVLAANASMLFIYEFPQRVAFWMRNTLIPLDMIFMSEDGVVQKVHVNAVPLDETLIPGGDQIKFVLEIKGGMSEILGIGPGSELRHPRIDQTKAAWPCE